MIEWKKYFDKIYCIHYEKHHERCQRIQSELKRVGILDSGIFKWEIGYDSPLFNILHKGINFRKNEDIQKDKFYGAFKCSLSHYFIMKNAHYMNYKRILIMEDDIIFLKDVSKIQKIIDNIPNTNVCLFDKFTYNPLWYHQIMKDNNTIINDYFRRFDDRIDLGSSACYSIDSKAIFNFITYLENGFCASDHIWNHYDENLFDISRSFSIINVARQKNYKNHNYENDLNEDVAYKFIGLNTNEY